MNKQKVFITGISKGIGRSIAELLNQKGFEVTGSCRNPEQLSDKIPGAKYIPLDLNDKYSISKCKELVGDIDILINNAGQSQIGAVEEIKTEDIRKIFDINFFGSIDLVKQFLPSMREKKKGLIINIGSMAGSFALPMYSSYCSSKAAFQMFSLCLRQELKQFGVTVVHVEPNDIKTSISPELIYKEGGPYENLAKTVREKVKQKMDKADSPDIVSRLILKIIKSNNTNPKYAIGGSACMLMFLKRFLSDRTAERITMRMYGLK
ncbi:MAG: SDR family oxidoreductase [Bacteroidales bacterium]|nr:SDR family oxidoreductase [Bacteroidales bacterium]